MRKCVELLKNCVQEEEVLSTKVLKSYGISANDLVYLKKAGYLESKKRGIYEFVDKKEDALLSSLERGEYEEAVKIIEFRLVSASGKELKDLNLYLFILNLLIDLPEELRDMVKSFSKEDILYALGEGGNIVENDARELILKQRFSQALDKYRSILNEDSIKDYKVLFDVLENVNELEIEFNNDINDLIDQKDYENLVMLLTKRQQILKLQSTHFAFLRIAEDMINIKETGLIPQSTEPAYNNIFSYIYSRNYDKALECVDKRVKLYGMLTDICSLIEDVKNKQKDNLIQEEKNVSPLVSAAFTCLKLYLEENNLVEYEDLVSNLMLLSLIKKDKSLNLLTETMSKIENRSYDFDLQMFIQLFYKALSDKSFDEARVYIKIIESAKKIGQICTLTDGLARILDITEANWKRLKTSEVNLLDKQSEKSESNATSIATEVLEIFKLEDNVKQEVVECTHEDEDEESLQFLEEQLHDTDSFQEDVFEADLHEVEAVDVVPNELDVNEPKDTMSLMRDIYEKISKERGIVVIDTNLFDNIQMVNRSLKAFKNMMYFKVVYDGEERLVFRIHNNTNINFRNLFKVAEQAYSNGDYQKHIETSLDIMENSYNLEYKFFGVLGMSYSKIGEYEKAIDCLKVAQGIADAKGKNIDYRTLIEKLEEEIENKKTMDL